MCKEKTCIKRYKKFSGCIFLPDISHSLNNMSAIEFQSLKITDIYSMSCKSFIKIKYQLKKHHLSIESQMDNHDGEKKS